jgi:hypothetical protein
MSTAELATSYAALILADDSVEITVCKITDSPASAAWSAAHSQPPKIPHHELPHLREGDELRPELNTLNFH